MMSNYHIFYHSHIDEKSIWRRHGRSPKNVRAFMYQYNRQETYMIRKLYAKTYHLISDLNFLLNSLRSTPLSLSEKPASSALRTDFLANEPGIFNEKFGDVWLLLEDDAKIYDEMIDWNTEKSNFRLIFDQSRNQSALPQF